MYSQNGFFLYTEAHFVALTNSSQNIFLFVHLILLCCFTKVNSQNSFFLYIESRFVALPKCSQNFLYNEAHFVALKKCTVIKVFCTLKLTLLLYPNVQ